MARSAGGVVFCHNNPSVSLSLDSSLYTREPKRYYLKLQRLSDIRDQVLGAFQTAGVADQIAADTGGHQLLFVHLTVGGPASLGGVCL